MDEKIKDVLDVNRTDELFDTSIIKSDSFSKTPYNDQNLKGAKMTLGFGNLHVNTAKAKMQAIKLLGFRNGVQGIKDSVSRKLRNKAKYGK